MEFFKITFLPFFYLYRYVRYKISVIVLEVVTVSNFKKKCLFQIASELEMPLSSNFIYMWSYYLRQPRQVENISRDFFHSNSIKLFCMYDCRLHIETCLFSTSDILDTQNNKKYSSQLISKYIDRHYAG